MIVRKDGDETPLHDDSKQAKIPLILFEKNSS